MSVRLGVPAALFLAAWTLVAWPAAAGTITESPTASRSTTLTASETPSASATASRTDTVTRTATASRTGTVTRTSSRSPSATRTPTASASGTVTRTQTSSPTITSTISRTATISGTSTQSATVTPTQPALEPFLWTSANVFQPAAGALRIVFETVDDAEYRVMVFNAAGERVARLFEGGVVGWTQVALGWDGKNEGGTPCGSGVYVIRLSSPHRAFWRRIGLTR